MPILILDKPLHLTSHDLVAQVRRRRGTRRVGHTGTLDPLASGVVVVCVDESTKLVQFLEADSKDYLAWIALGAGTPTLDAEGPLEQVVDVPELQAAQVRELLKGFLGQQQQLPPQYSALQVGGQRAYAVARAGGQLDLPARPVTIHALELLAVGHLSALPRCFHVPAEAGDIWNPAPSGRCFELPTPLGDFPGLLLWASVGSGTYLRSLARDIGAALGVPAHLAGLVRTRVGRFSLSQALNLEEVATAGGVSELTALGLPLIEASDALALALKQGKKPAHSAQGRHLVVQGERLIAVVNGDGQQLRVVRGLG